MDYLLKVARLYYQENMSQQEIADYLNISRVKVYRLLKQAREDGMVKIELRAPVQDFSELELKIEKYFGINQCVIIPSSDSMEILYSGFGEALGGIISQYFKDGMKIGVGWGQTIKGAVEKMRLSKKYNIEVFPAIGGYGVVYDDIHANSIVSLLANKTNGTGYVLNCPAIIESKYTKEVFLEESNIKSIINKFEELDMAIVPIGYIDTDITIFKAKHIKAEDLEYLNSLGVVGDINSNFLDIHGNLVENEIQERIINVSLELLRKIKRTIAICYGEKKITATRAALKSGVINTLITDSCIAEHILED